MYVLNSRPARALSLAAVVATLALAVSLLAAVFVNPAAATETETGGATPSESKSAAEPELGPPGKARIAPDGRTAIAPADAPPLVQRAIAYANKITSKPYRYGGGHASFTSSGYDCSGGISFMLRGAKQLDAPLDSTSFMKWGESGRGTWISVFANPGHAYAIVAGLRWDTSGPGEKGPRWRKAKRSSSGYTIRHPQGF